MQSKVFETIDTKLAAALMALGHELRNPGPCAWHREINDGKAKEECIFFFDPEQEGAELNIEQIVKAWGDRNVFDEFEQTVLDLVPEDKRDLIRGSLHAAAACAMRHWVEKYKLAMALLNRSKNEIGMSLERRGDKTLYAGRNVSEARIAELKQAAGF